jgi:Cellulase (glycosyl hydrolase family 5)
MSSEPEAGGRTGDGEVAGSGGHLLRRAGRSILPVGAHVVPVEGPDWPWRVGAESFDRAFAAMAASGLDAARIDLLWSAIEPDEGRYDEAHLRVLDDVLEAARRYGVLLHPTLFIGGEVGDAYWDVPWRSGRHPHADPGMRGLQARHAAELARRWRGDPAILAWDLTDEPPFWIARDTADEDARAWTGELVEAIRAEDPDHLITIGTSGQEVGWGPFRADVVAEALDFTCVHPYPIYQEEVYPDSLLAPRMTHAAAFETALAAGAGRPVMVHEYGASSTQFDPEAIAAYDRLLSWSSLGRGATGYFAWCWTDAEPAAYARAPYVRQPHETQFGVTDWRGRQRPRGRVLSRLASTVRRLDLDAHAASGPAAEGAAILVPHEYARPYDTASFGLDRAPSGAYRPAERAWTPERDPTPLSRAWLNAFVLAARADLQVRFPREDLNGSWPDVDVLLLPAPLASTTTSLWHVRTSFWSGAAEFYSRGGVLYVSCSADVAIPEMEDVLGCRIVDRAPAAPPSVLRFVAPWGPFRSGDELRLPEGGDLQTRGVRLHAGRAKVVAVDGDGEPSLVVATRGAGHAVTCAAPVELLLARVPDAHAPADRSWGLYAGVAALAGLDALVAHPDVTTGAVLGGGGGAIALTNHGPSGVDAELRIPEDAAAIHLVDGGEAVPLPAEDAVVSVPLEPYGSALVSWAARGAGP